MFLGVFGPVGIPELVLILVVVVFLFGARRIPELARGLGEGIRGFRSSLRGDGGDGGADSKDDDKPSGKLD